VVPVHAKKAYRECGDLGPLILNLALDGMNIQLHTKAPLLLRKEPRYPLNLKLSGPRADLDVLERKNILCPARIEPLDRPLQ
jgi:hypothetical protein